jgi:hypothetical protein
VSRNRIVFFGCLAVALVGIVVYGINLFLFLLSRPTLGISRGSASLRDSQGDGFYVGTYTPNKRQIALLDSFIVTIPDAWIEHAWTPGFSVFLRDTKKVCDGYKLYIPIPHDRGAPFTFTIGIAEADHKFTRYPGMGYAFHSGSALGWEAHFDTLPDILTFTVKQKKRDEDSWTDAIIIDTIQFKRAF